MAPEEINKRVDVMSALSPAQQAIGALVLMREFCDKVANATSIEELTALQATAAVITKRILA